MKRIRIDAKTTRTVFSAVIGEPEQVKSCQHRGEQIAEIRCDQCGQGKGTMKPVYVCAIYGRCTHRLEQRGQQTQEVPTKVCVGCDDGPWAIPRDWLR